jgi:hypothetical protein
LGDMPEVLVMNSLKVTDIYAVLKTRFYVKVLRKHKCKIQCVKKHCTMINMITGLDRGIRHCPQLRSSLIFKLLTNESNEDGESFPADCSVHFNTLYVGYSNL